MNDTYIEIMQQGLTIRERRRIYEDAICIVAQAQKIDKKFEGVTKDRSIQVFIDNQTSRCVSILAAVLGYHETVVEVDGVRTKMLNPEDNNADYAITKSKFEDIVQQLPENKRLRESLWKSFVKRDKKSTNLLKNMVA